MEWWVFCCILSAILRRFKHLLEAPVKHGGEVWIRRLIWVQSSMGEIQKMRGLVIRLLRNIFFGKPLVDLNDLQRVRVAATVPLRNIGTVGWVFRGVQSTAKRLEWRTHCLWDLLTLPSWGRLAFRGAPWGVCLTYLIPRGPEAIGLMFLWHVGLDWPWMLKAKLDLGSEKTSGKNSWAHLSWELNLYFRIPD